MTGDEAASLYQDMARLRRVQKRRVFRLRAIAVCVIPLVPFIQASWRGDAWLGEATRAAGLWLIVACVFGRAWCMVYLGGRRVLDLVAVGPYSVSRNPLYMFSFIGILGVGLRTGMWSLGLAFLTLAIAVLRPVIKVEEEVLGRRFGPAFAEYCARVPRFGPALRRWCDADQLLVTPAYLYRAIGDAGFFLMCIPLIDGLGYLQAREILPAIIHLP
jgi:protein-S-isoprenylcysteine O-methyltransferase Ste14